MGLLPDYKDLIDLAKKLGNVEAQEQIIALREDHWRVREENLRLREENQELKAKLEASSLFTYEAPYYWKMVNGQRTGPFCQVCKDTSHKEVRLHPFTQRRGWWDCKVCRNHFTERNCDEYSDNGVLAASDDWMGN